MSNRIYKIDLDANQIDLLLNVLKTHTENFQQELSEAIFHEDMSAVSDAEASLRALDAVTKVLKISE